MKRWMVSLFFLLQGPSGCALYHPKPLAVTPSLLESVPRLIVVAD